MRGPRRWEASSRMLPNQHSEFLLPVLIKALFPLDLKAASALIATCWTQQNSIAGTHKPWLSFFHSTKKLKWCPFILLFSAQGVKWKMLNSFSSPQSQHQPQILYKALAHVPFRWQVLVRGTRGGKSEPIKSFISTHTYGGADSGIIPASLKLGTILISQCCCQPGNVAGILHSCREDHG